VNGGTMPGGGSEANIGPSLQESGASRLNALWIAIVSFACVFGAALLGVVFRRILPEHHLSDESRATVDRTIRIIVTLAALVLGLLVASAKGSYDAINDKMQQISADVILLDRTMARYGPETKDARELLRRVTGSMIRTHWPEVGIQVPSLDGIKPSMGLQEVQERVRRLAPSDEAQRQLQARAVQLSGETALATWLLLELTQDRVPAAFLVILVSWLVIIFFGFGLFAPSNGTVVCAFLFSAFAASGAIFLILEMYDPVGGLVKIPVTPLLTALENIGR
jgi:hypothetical protein